MPWTNKVKKAIEALADEAPSGQMVFLTESDLKVQLCSRLHAALRDEANTVTVNTESPWYDDETGSGPVFIDVTVFDRALLQREYIPHLQRKGYLYDGPSIAIELKYCRHPDDVPGVVSDIDKLQPLASKPNNSCFVLALARTQELFTEAAQLIDAAHQREVITRHPVTVYLCGVFVPQQKKTWEFRHPSQ
jgi:hypothetical protein